MRGIGRIRHRGINPGGSGEGRLDCLLPTSASFRSTVSFFASFIFLVVLALTTSVTVAQTSAPSTTPADKNFVRISARDSARVGYSGRIAFNPTGEALLSWSGSSATLRFEGTSCRAIFKSRGGLYRILINGQPAESPLRTAPSDTVLWLAKDLPYGEYTVTVYKRTEPAIGTGVFAGFEIQGRALPKAPPLSRRIEFVGGSSLCGFGVLDTNITNGYSPQTQDHYLSYAAHASRRLNATSHAVAWSGMGLSRNAGGDSGTTMPTLWQKTDPTRPTVYDFRFQPEVVVIDLAVHDFAITPLPDSARYVNPLRSFIQSVTTRYPAAHIVLVAGTTLSDSMQALSRAIHYHQCVAASSGGKVSALRFTPLPNGNGLSASGWPNAVQQAHNAEELVAHLGQLLQWPSTSVRFAPLTAPQPFTRTYFPKAQIVLPGQGLAPQSMASPSAAHGRRILSVNGRVLSF